MYIKGIGKISKKEVMSILTADGKVAVKNGDITLGELGEMYKLEMVKKNSKVGSLQSTFSESYKWIPDDLKSELSPEQLAELTDKFYDCYSTGKAAK